MWRREQLALGLAGIAMWVVTLPLGGCAKRPEPKRPNVVLVSLDTLRADRLGSYGYDRETSPFLDAFAAEGTLFERAVVNTHGTTPSHASMLSGTYQETHLVGVETTKHGLAYPLPPDLPLLSEMLAEVGYRTVAFTDGGNAGRRFGFDRGFDHFDDKGGGLRRISRRLLRYLDESERGDEPLFLFVHTYEVHSPYEPPESWAEPFLDPDTTSTFRATSENLVRFAHRAHKMPPQDLRRASDLYDGGIRYADHLLERLFEELSSRDLLEGALVVITSDHGEEFGEHGGLLHRGLLYDELIRVPLIFRGPGIAAERSAALASTVDIVPSILGRLGLELGSAEGQDLFSEGDLPRYAVSQYGKDLYSVTGERWKLIVHPASGAQELYDLVEDPGEIADQSTFIPERVLELEGTLRTWLRIPRPTFEDSVPGALSDEDRSRLESLGYLTGTDG